MIWAMIWSGLQSLWHFVFGWAGIDILVGCAAVAVAILEPPWLHRLIPNLRTVAVGAAVIAFTLTGAIAYGYRNGSNEVKRQWDAAAAREAVNGEKARDDALRSVGSISTDRRMFDNDPDNRDRPAGQERNGAESPLRRLAKNPLLRKQ